MSGRAIVTVGVALLVLLTGAGTLWWLRVPARPDAGFKPPQAAFAADTTLGADKRTALVIGNAAYGDAQLGNPLHDARAMAKVLGESGFAVMERENLNQIEMRRAIRDFGMEIGNGGVGLFYFAGHAIQAHGHNFLIPIAADIQREDELEDQAVDANLVLRKMESASNRLNVVILDACRNNPFARSFHNDAVGLAPMDAPPGTLVAFATSPGKMADDGSGENGLYTGNLVMNLSVPGLRIEEVFKRTRAAVRRDSNGTQVPWENTSLTDDFYFKPPPGLAASAPPVLAMTRPSSGVLGEADGREPAGRPRSIPADDPSSAAVVATYQSKDYAQSFALAEPLAEQGNITAQYYLGLMFRRGDGTQQSLPDAIKWLRKAAEQHHAQAQQQLGVIYQMGLGVDRDYAEALQWYHRAAGQGNHEAEYALGEMYRSGLGVPQSKSDAEYWYAKAAAAGPEQATQPSVTASSGSAQPLSRAP